MKQQLKNVEWRKKYPNHLENEKWILERRGWGFRLIYDVFEKKENCEIFLGTCIVKQTVIEDNHNCNCNGKCKECKCKQPNYVIETLVVRDDRLVGKFPEISEFLKKRL